MRKIRIYQDLVLTEGNALSIDKRASNHLCNVLRLKAGDNIWLFNGSGYDFRAEITNADKRATTLTILEKVAVDNESSLHIHLGQAISKTDRMDYAIQKSIELGVTQLSPIITEYCTVKLNQTIIEKKMSHWHSILISACEQCGRSTLPKLNPPISLHQWCDNRPEASKVVLLPGGKSHLKDLENVHTSISLLIGPEGGLSPSEVLHCTHKGFTHIGLGPRTLRTETAACASIAILQAQYGDL